MVGIGSRTINSTRSGVASSLREEGDRKMYPKVDLSPEGVVGRPKKARPKKMALQRGALMDRFTRKETRRSGFGV